MAKIDLRSLFSNMMLASLLPNCEVPESAIQILMNDFGAVWSVALTLRLFLSLKWLHYHQNDLNLVMIQHQCN